MAAVRIIAATKTRGADSVMCRMWLPDNRTLTLKARVKVMRSFSKYRREKQDEIFLSDCTPNPVVILKRNETGVIFPVTFTQMHRNILLSQRSLIKK